MDFWFKELDPKFWWSKDLKFDLHLVSRFGDLHSKAVRCELFAWRSCAHGRLAEILVLDQFSRNIFRDTSKAFSVDAMALVLAQEVVDSRADKELNPVERNFLYMPYMHSESAYIHRIALQLFRDNGLQENLVFEERHKEIIDRFGRYPHGNLVLGRDSTEEKIEFMKLPGSSF